MIISTLMECQGGVGVLHRRLPARAEVAQDRKGRALGYDDILHYQRIVVALAETGRVMRELDGVWGFQHTV